MVPLWWVIYGGGGGGRSGSSSNRSSYEFIDKIVYHDIIAIDMGMGVLRFWI